MLLSIVGRGGMGIRTTNGKRHIRHKTYSSSWKHAQLMIRGYHVQIQPTASPLLVILSIFIEYLVCVCVCVCVCACVRACVCVCVCDIYFKKCISQVALYKIHGRYNVERGSAFSSFFLVFLDCVKYKILSAVAVFTPEEQEK